MPAYLEIREAILEGRPLTVHPVTEGWALRVDGLDDIELVADTSDELFNDIAKIMRSEV